MLNRFGISLPQEETERVDILRYTWDKLLSLAVSDYPYLINVHHKFLTESSSVSPVGDLVKIPYHPSNQCYREFKLSVDDFTGSYAQVSLFPLVTVVTVTLAEWSNGGGYSPS